MVDLEKLRAKKRQPKPTDPTEIFRRLPKPAGINDLYSSQADVLKAWYEKRTRRDVVVKLHTGGGKTLVGLLMAQSTLNEFAEPVLYLTPTLQLVDQTIQKATASGISAVPYVTGATPLDDEFVNAGAVMVATYKALFNGRSKFGLRGGANPQRVGTIILDDAHAAFPVVRESFTFEVNAEKQRKGYEGLTGLFRKAFHDLDRVGTFDDITSGDENNVLEVPHWAWLDQLDAVRQLLGDEAGKPDYVWPLLRDRLHLCHALISRRGFVVTPILPLLDSFPTFSEAPRRIYMSATMADDSEIIRTFGADPAQVQAPLTSRSVAGVSERMILIPELMSFNVKAIEAATALLKTAAERKLGSVVLVPSQKAADSWKDVATVPSDSDEVGQLVQQLQAGAIHGPVVFYNRYDGIDLPNDSCRLLVVHGLPKGTGDYELWRASALYGAATIARMLAQRLEQGMGRGARGSGDYCVVLLVGGDLANWIATDMHWRFFTTSTRAQLDMGVELSREVRSTADLAGTVRWSFERDAKWVAYHAETLAEGLDEQSAPSATNLELATAERKAVDLWSDGYHEKAIARIDRFLEEAKSLDSQSRGWMHQTAARIAHHWGNRDLAQDHQQQAFAYNRNLTRPKTRPAYRALQMPGSQEEAIAKRIGAYRLRRGFLQVFEETVALLTPRATSSQVEHSLAELGRMLGLSAERFDDAGEGPDVIWLLPGRVGFVIEVKSGKKAKADFKKGEHGQLLVAAEWFAKNYPDHECVRVSVHPTSTATKPAAAAASYVLTYQKLAVLLADARELFRALVESQLPNADLAAECTRLLADSPIRADRLAKTYLLPFEERE